MAKYKLDVDYQYINEYIPCVNYSRKYELTCRCSLLSDYKQELMEIGIKNGSDINEQFI